ncbi:MAG: agmatinase, partial [Candidatus Altiarchaeota archaeon]|nr:agmatinase [Candidatus Altiarchaeota archaeon]
AGNVDVVYGNAVKTVEIVEEVVGEILGENPKARLITLGGEHLVSLPVVKNLSEGRKFSVVSLDAHMDFKDEYLGERLSHSTVMRRVHELKIPVFEIGVRTFDNNEFDYAKEERISFCGIGDAEIKKVLSAVKGSVYLSVDFDVIDPAYAPGVGTPEPMGLSVKQVQDVIRTLGSRITAIDLNEICPPYDQSNITSVAAARILLDYMMR